MSTLSKIEPAHATEPVAEVLAEVKKALGSVPNMAKTMAHSPALVRGWLALAGALSDGVIPAPVREQLALATAEYNHCEYCLSAHSFLGSKIAKLDPEEIERARHADSADPHVAALLALSDAIARGRGNVEDAALKTAQAAGVTDAEIAEVIGNLALNILTNYFNNLADTDNEFPLVTPLAHN